MAGGVEIDGGTLCRGPELRVEGREEWRERWCFKCHKRQMFYFQFLVPVEASYYGPLPQILCGEGHVDGDAGFGREREWEM